jgi:chromosome segregation ATPase
MKRLLATISLIILVSLNSCQHGQKKDKGDIKQIHEREVQKAIQELSAEKLGRKKKAEERKKRLAAQKVECRTLEARLKGVTAQKGAVLAELDNIRRPHLFRSKAKKEAQLREQLRRLDQLEAQAASLKGRIAKCKRAIDSLEDPAKPLP